MSNIITLKEEAKLEVYNYIDKYIRPLPKDKNDIFNEFTDEFIDNDVDALRHAYVSGVYTMDYGADAAEILGRLHELVFSDTSSSHLNTENMDLWNNAIGRKYGEKAKTREELFNLIHNALKNGEFIIDLDDTRKYKGKKYLKRKPKSLVIKIKESKTGANTIFYDVNKKTLLTKDEFLKMIKEGMYPNYSYKTVDGDEIPISKRDRYTFNNLG